MEDKITKKEAQEIAMVDFLDICTNIFDIIKKKEDQISEDKPKQC